MTPDLHCPPAPCAQCDPYFTNVTDKCTFVQWNRACQADVHHIAYLPLFYCVHDDGRALVALGFIGEPGAARW